MRQCPVCAEEGGRYAVDVGSHQVVKCGACGLEYTLPIPTDQELSAFYAQYQDIRARQDVVMRNAARNLSTLGGLGCEEASEILDFGAGHGDFVRVAGARCQGVELGSPGAERVHGSLRAFRPQQFDFVTLWGVLEHLNHPLEILRELMPLLKPNGYLVLTTVDAEGLIPYYYKPVEHLTYWTKPSFQALFRQLGLEMCWHKPYRMEQAKEVYVDRLLSRTPEGYRAAFAAALPALPDYVEVPTNEVLVAARKV